MADKKVHINAKGRVQGVFFRSNAQKKASGLGLTGWVKNLSDGSVDIVAEGEEAKLQELVEWAKSGPSSASVSDIDISFAEAEGGLSGFNIRY